MPSLDASTCTMYTAFPKVDWINNLQWTCFACKICQVNELDLFIDSEI